MQPRRTFRALHGPYMLLQFLLIHPQKNKTGGSSRPKMQAQKDNNVEE